MITQTCGEHEKLLTKIFRINGINTNNNIVYPYFIDALNGTVRVDLKQIDGTLGPLLPRNAIVRSVLVNFYGQTFQITEKPYQQIAIPLQTRVSEIYQYEEYTKTSPTITVEISGPKIEDETSLSAKREQLIDFDLVVFYNTYE